MHFRRHQNLLVGFFFFQVLGKSRQRRFKFISFNEQNIYNNRPEHATKTNFEEIEIRQRRAVSKINRLIYKNSLIYYFHLDSSQIIMTERNRKKIVRATPCPYLQAFSPLLLSSIEINGDDGRIEFRQIANVKHFHSIP